MNATTKPNHLLTAVNATMQAPMQAPIQAPTETVEQPDTTSAVPSFPPTPALGQGTEPPPLMLPTMQKSSALAQEKKARKSSDGIVAPLLNRELSLLEFNRRVLMQARLPHVPPLERLRYICIVSSNLDEFFEVRIAPELQARAGVRTLPVSQADEDALDRVAEVAHALVAEQYGIYQNEVMPLLAQNNVVVLSHGERDAAQRRWVQEFFRNEVKPLLLPVGLDPAHPFPQVANKSLNFVVRLGGKDAFGRANHISIVKVPRVLPRVIRLPQRLSGERQAFVLLTSVIRAHLHELFVGREVKNFSQFRVTRDSDLSVDEEDVSNLRQALRSGLSTRHYGHAVRLEVSATCEPELVEMLRTQFGLLPTSVYKVQGPVNLVRLNQLIDLCEAPQLRFPVFKPAWPKSFSVHDSVFDALDQRDVLLHHPFQSFDAVMQMLRQAATDPTVLAIRQTIYRTGNESPLMELLIEAVKRGKEVTVVLELKARFDEETNINWAERLESIGAQVVYGVVGLKTHAKLLLVTRRVGGQLRRYAHLSTGNYNPGTARLYTDLGLMTSDAKLTEDVEQLFLHLASQVRLARMHRLLVAPFELHQQLMRHVLDAELAARKGKSARIVVKVNSLTDETLIQALARAGRAGVQIDLIVRGACQLAPGQRGVSDNVRVRSVVGRFLEHSRVFYFRSDDEEAMYLSSADWMSRNMFRRIEVAWPVSDPALRQRIVDECLLAYLHDGSAWRLDAKGAYTPGDAPQRSAQLALMRRYDRQFQPIADPPPWNSSSSATPKPKTSASTATSPDH